MEENKKKALDESQLDEVAGGISFMGGLRNVKKKQEKTTISPAFYFCNVIISLVESHSRYRT